MSIRSLCKKCYRVLFPEPVKGLLHRTVRKIYSITELNHKVYGKIYLPYYSMTVPISGEYPPLFNKYGEQIKLFFVRDDTSAHSPYTNCRYFQWDRYNFGLDTHFYYHKFMLETMGKPVRRYGVLSESEALVPDDYTLFEKHRGLEKDFDLIFTHSAKILDSVPNARYVPYCSGSWYTIDETNGHEAYKNKTKNISILSSNRTRCELNIYRIAVAQQCQARKLADTFGTFPGVDGGGYVNMAVTLKEYRFAIAIENAITPYWFTERITSCFASMTIPVYLGATKIGAFFNSDGIITFNKGDDIETVLRKCTKEFYEEHLDAVIDNFNRIKDYNAGDRMYKKYLCGEASYIAPEDFFK